MTKLTIKADIVVMPGFQVWSCFLAAGTKRGKVRAFREIKGGSIVSQEKQFLFF